MKYQNPILYGDYSDPDVVRVGVDYYMISSSFTYLPGIPLLHSRDLVHWQLINYVAQSLPFKRYDKPAHKCGTWAPSIRYHQGLFYVYCCLPDEGLMLFTAKDPQAVWECHYVKDTCGWIDPCPLWDEDGSAYLLHGFAASRCGINNILFLHRMRPDGLEILDAGRLVYDGHAHGDTTTEGPKMYRRGGYYYILCPAGGVQQGYQLALRASTPFGPYERRVVLAQGKTPVNGPHQGGWVDTGNGQDWFIHFQDVGVYGRIPHLQPVRWVEDWPVMGENGAPVMQGDVPGNTEENDLPTTDLFKGKLGLQWQWQANPNADWLRILPNGLRLMAAPAPSLFHAGQFLSQLMQYRDFDMDVCLALHGGEGDCAGIAMMGMTYHSLALEKGKLVLRHGEAVTVSIHQPEPVTETILAETPWENQPVYLRLMVCDGECSFAYSADGQNFQTIGNPCLLTAGGWVSARPGLFCLNSQGDWGGYADFGYCRFTQR